MLNDEIKKYIFILKKKTQKSDSSQPCQLTHKIRNLGYETKITLQKVNQKQLLSLILNKSLKDEIEKKFN